MAPWITVVVGLALQVVVVVAVLPIAMPLTWIADRFAGKTPANDC
jgi:hypothetical protein